MFNSQNQTKIDVFSSLHQSKSNPNIRCIPLSSILPREDLVKSYSMKFGKG
jgi:hypothetical protein